MIKNFIYLFLLSIMTLSFSAAEGQQNSDQIIHGECNQSIPYTCIRGNFISLPSEEINRHYYIWQCLGLNGGRSDDCFISKPQFITNDLLSNSSDIYLSNPSDIDLSVDVFVIRQAMASYSEKKEDSIIPPDMTSENIRSSEVLRLLEVSDEVDAIISNLCVWGRCTLFHRFVFSNREHVIIQWASGHYHDRQNEGEPEEIDAFAEIDETDLSARSFQRLIELTREKDQIIEGWRRGLY